MKPYNPKTMKCCCGYTFPVKLSRKSSTLVKCPRCGFVIEHPPTHFIEKCIFNYKKSHRPNSWFGVIMTLRCCYCSADKEVRHSTIHRGKYFIHYCPKVRIICRYNYKLYRNSVHKWNLMLLYPFAAAARSVVIATEDALFSSIALNATDTIDIKLGNIDLRQYKV